MNICAIPRGCVYDIWPQVEPGLQDLLDNHTLGAWTVEEIRDKCATGEWLLVVVSDDGEIIANLVCNINEGENRLFEIGLCWGTAADAWSGDIIAACDQVGREMGCDRLTVDGRPGWRNIMRREGFTVKSVRYMRDI